MLLSELVRLFIAFLLALVISRRGLRRHSLSSTGAIAAFLVGFLSWASSTRFGLTLYVFYLSGTRATKYKSSRKAQIEAEHSTLGNRSAYQVCASSLPAVIIAVIYVLLYRFDAPVSTTFGGRGNLLLAYLLFFAACAGDTFASEVGIVGSEPVLVTAPWRKVPRGTNGGITLGGTVASAVGGLIVGGTFFLAGSEWTWSQVRLVWVGAVGGVVGSLVDSLLGAVVQASWLDTQSGKVLNETPPGPTKGDGKRYQHVSGIDVLSGESVNVLSAVLTAALAPFLLPWFPPMDVPL